MNINSIEINSSSILVIAPVLRNDTKNLDIYQNFEITNQMWVFHKENITLFLNNIPLF